MRCRLNAESSFAAEVFFAPSWLPDSVRRGYIVFERASPPRSAPLVVNSAMIRLEQISDDPTDDFSIPANRSFGRYEILRLLGAGAFGAVYEAVDPALDASVAVKVLADNHATDEDLRDRFIREARVLRRVGGDRLVAVYDIGERRGQPYFVMELARGGTLADRLGSEPAPDAAAINRIVGEIESCLTAVHGAGVVHRDLKPTNLLIRGPDNHHATLLDDDEQLVLGDFGLAREIAASSLTYGGGTEGFMAPEQRTPTASIDQRADIYSATALVYSLYAGSPPDPGGGHDPQLAPGALANWLATGLAVDPNGRHADARTWAEGFRTAVNDHKTSAATPSVQSAAPASSRRRWAALAGVAAAVAVAVLVLIVALNGGDNDGGPDIIGPSMLVVGEQGRYSFEADPDATYRWTGPGDVVITDPVLEVVPTSSGQLTIKLVEVRNGTERSSMLLVTVVAGESDSS